MESKPTGHVASPPGEGNQPGITGLCRSKAAAVYALMGTWFGWILKLCTRLVDLAADLKILVRNPAAVFMAMVPTSRRSAVSFFSVRQAWSLSVSVPEFYIPGGIPT